jgi:hypothetical protein
MKIIFTHFWLVAIAVNMLNICIYSSRLKKYINEDPSLADGYSRLLKGYALWSSLPWIVMGAGILTGNASSFFDYLRPREMNSFVLLFYCSILFIVLAGNVWIFLLGGAEFLGRHPGFVTIRAGFSHSNVTNPGIIKLLSLAMTVITLFAMLMIWTSNIPPPRSSRNS